MQQRVMRAVVLRKNPQQIYSVEKNLKIPQSKPGSSGKVLIKNKVAGLNFVDVYYKNGLYRKSSTLEEVLGDEESMILGVEGVGEVVGVASVQKEQDNVIEWNTRKEDHISTKLLGKRVSYHDQLCSGSFAEYTVVDSSKILEVPDDISDNIACALHVQGITAHYLATSVFPLTAKEKCAIWACSGGTGLLLSQIAKLKGAYIIGITSKPDKASNACDVVLDAKSPDLVDDVLKASNGEGVSVVYDSVGRKSWQQSLSMLKRRGTAVFYGNASGPIPPIDPLLLAARGSIYITRPTINDFMSSPEEVESRGKDLFSWYRKKLINVKIDSEYNIEKISDAFDYLEAGKTNGKIIIKI